MPLRSTLATAVSGSFAGLAVAPIATPMESALAALLTAGAVALADWAARRGQARRHEERFLEEHRKTREAVTLSRRIPRRGNNKRPRTSRRRAEVEKTEANPAT